MLRRFNRTLIALLVVAALNAPPPLDAAPAAAADPDPAEFVPGEILVKFKPNRSDQKKDQAHTKHGGRVKETKRGIDVQVVTVAPGEEKAKRTAYKNDPDVLFAELNGIYYAVVGGPNDPQVGQQWQYNNTGQSGGTPDADIDAFEAWQVTSGSPSVAIAILDTGIDQSHEDLSSKITKNINFSTSPTLDDLYGHGTHVAGSAAASANNSIGVAGTCPNCTLYNVKVLSDTGSGASSGVASGIIWAADNGAKVINMSLGGTVGSATMESAINYAWSKGVVVAASAGNSGVSSPSYPAYYANAIAVASTDRNDLRSSFSNYGSWVDVAAPGSSILSTAPDHTNTIWGSGVKYGTISGTSMASPHVAGLAGLVWSSGICGAADAACVRRQIETKADPIAGTGVNWTYGRINAYNSVAATTPVCTLTQTASYNGGNMTLTFNLAASVPTVWHLYVEVAGLQMPIFAEPIPAVSPALALGPYTFAFPPMGQVGWLTQLTTATGTVLCGDSDQVDTGAAPAASQALPDVQVPRPNGTGAPAGE